MDMNIATRGKLYGKQVSDGVTEWLGDWVTDESYAWPAGFVWH